MEWKVAGRQGGRVGGWKGLVQDDIMWRNKQSSGTCSARTTKAMFLRRGGEH